VANAQARRVGNKEHFALEHRDGCSDRWTFRWISRRRRRLRAPAVAGVRARRAHEGRRRNGSFRSHNLSQLRDNIARHQGKRGYNDRARDADRRSCWSADWRRLDGILSWPTDSIGVLAVPTDQGGPGCLRLDDGTPDEVMTTHQGVTCHL